MQTYFDIKTPAGMMDIYAAHPDGAGPWPVILFLMDGLGVRPVMRAMADRLARQGYYVFLPNLYYRAGRAEELDLAADQSRMFELFSSLNTDKVAADMTALFDHIERDDAAPAYAGKPPTANPCSTPG